MIIDEIYPNKKIVSNNFTKQGITHIGDWKTKLLNLIKSGC